MSAPALQELHPQDYEAALHLIEHGVPVFIVKRSPKFPHGGHGNSGYSFPEDWQNTEPDPSVLRKWRPGNGLGAVMGHVVDGLDLDPRNGGELPDHLRPRSYGKQNTPSGGTHDLIATLGVRSRDSVPGHPGVDVKAGVAGLGRGFLFLSPTEKINKETGEVSQYTWAEYPDLTPLLLEDDESGLALAKQVNTGRSFSSNGPEYSGATYEDLTESQREQADAHVEGVLFDWKVRLGEASGWNEGERDAKGRGWEALSRDAAWAVAMLAVCPWTGVSESDAEDIYSEIMPAALTNDANCRGKWYSGILDKASAQPVALPPWWSEVFFEQTDVLRHVRNAALASQVPPQGLLAILIGRVLSEVPIPTCLPPLAVATGLDGGSPASTNIGIALVARSGGGKSTIIKASRVLLGMVGEEQKYIEKGMGSGEGLIDLFLQPELAENDKGDLKPTGSYIVADDPRAILLCNEVEQMAAVGADRQGSTFGSMLRQSLTGEQLSTSNARAGGRSRNVPELTYRMVSVVGVQPSRADVLLREEGVGTPQRFLWAMVDDLKEEVPHPKDCPDWPGSLNWVAPTDWPDHVEYPQHIKDEILDAQWRERRGESVSGLDGHARLTRLKVAFGLALLHGATKIDDQWWYLSGLLMARSREVQQYCQGELHREADRREISRETRRAKAVDIATEVVVESKLQRAVDATTRALQRKPGEQLQWSNVKPHNRVRVGLETEEIIDELRKNANIEVEEYDAQGRVAYRLTWTGE